VLPVICYRQFGHLRHGPVGHTGIRYSVDWLRNACAWNLQDFSAAMVLSEVPKIHVSCRACESKVAPWMVKTAAGCRIFKVFVIFASLVRSGGRNAECLKFSCYDNVIYCYKFISASHQP